ncbi:MAG: spermidine/putrescine ABC transporter ATP-binding protein, partial [Lachnospiraceae bacterium]|nr:spermidine/putrescine ABC transporter ATP-binding protein [Lachnospiraceae bacterium]
MDGLLKVEHVSYSYHSLLGETPALSDITFFVEENEFLAIVGPSGFCKSSLLSKLAVLMKH